MTILRPYALLLILLWLPFVWFWLRSRSGNPWLKVIDSSLLDALQPNVSSSLRQKWWVPAFLLLIILALAGPALTNKSQASANQGALFIVLDNSLSMAAADIAPDRSTRAKRMAVDWVRSGLFDQATVITYSASAHTVTPLTRDASTIELQLQELSPYLMPQFGNRADLAFEKLNDTLDGYNGPKHLLWLTDDVQMNHSSAIEQTINNFASATLVAVGTEEGSPIPLPNGQGFLSTENGIVIVKTDIDAIHNAGLQLSMQLARLGQQPDPDLFAELNTNGQVKGGQTDIGFWLLIPITLMWLLKVRTEIAMSVFVLLIVWPNPNAPMASSWFLNSEQRAYDAWQQKDLTTAIESSTNLHLKGQALFDAERYEEAADVFKTMNTADGFYNAGNALAQTGNLKEAIAAYDQALSLAEHSAALNNKEKLEAFLENQPNESGQQQGDSQQQNSQNAESDKNSGESQAQENSPEPSESSQKDSSNEQQRQESAGEDGSEKNAAAQQPDEQQSNTDNLRDEQATEQILNQLETPSGSLLQQKFQYQFQQEPSETDSTIW